MGTATCRSRPAPAEGGRRGDERAAHARTSRCEGGAQAAEEAERELLRRTLAETRWNRKEAASMLQISYKALLNKLKKWEVDDPVAASR